MRPDGCTARGPLSHYAHARRVLHRDLKPSNVMLGDFGEVYVLDWGLAKVLDGQDAEDAVDPLDEPDAATEGAKPVEEGEGPRTFAVFANVGLFSSPTEPPVVPDVMLSLDVTIPSEMSEAKNRSYFVWRYGKGPELVVEIVSNRKGDDVDRKLRRYQRVGLDYYVVFDPLKKLTRDTVRAFERLRGRYAQMGIDPDSDG